MTAEAPVAEPLSEERIEELLDRALEDTFPASDPFGVTVN
jgi:hypothetical protein